MSAPIISMFYDRAPCPRAEVLFESFAAGTASVTGWRSTGLIRYQVRGIVRSAVAGALTRIDFEIPFGVSVTYWAEQFDSAGVSLGETAKTTVKFNVKETWVHNPLDPQGALQIVLTDSAAASISRPVPGDVVFPLGRSRGVVISGPRRGIAGVALDCYTQSDGDADKFDALLGGPDRSAVPVLCFRVGADMRIRLPRPLFASVLDLQEEAVDLRYGGEMVRWRMSGTEVSPPAPGIFIPLLTRADINAFYPTRAAVNADNPSRLSVNRRYDLIGAA